MTSIRVSFLATMTHLNFPAATCSYNKPFLHPVKVMFSLFQNNFTDSNSLHISLKACVLPHPPASQIWLCQHLSSYSLLCPLFGQYSLLSWLFSPLPPHSSYSVHDILQLKKISLHNWFWCKLWLQFIYQHNTEYSGCWSKYSHLFNYKLLLTYCLRRAMNTMKETWNPV